MMKSLKENEDYKLVHHADHPDAWAIRLEDPYPETVVVFGEVGYDDKQESLTFDFQIVETPDNLLTEDDEGLQTHVGMVLLSIIDQGLEEGFVKAYDRESGDELTN
jgi:hypothetical protein